MVKEARISKRSAATFNRQLLSPLLETWAAGKYWGSGLRDEFLAALSGPKPSRPTTN